MDIRDALMDSMIEKRWALRDAIAKRTKLDAIIAKGFSEEEARKQLEAKGEFVESGNRVIVRCAALLFRSAARDGHHRTDRILVGKGWTCRCRRIRLERTRVITERSLYHCKRFSLSLSPPAEQAAQVSMYTASSIAFSSVQQIFSLVLARFRCHQRRRPQSLSPLSPCFLRLGVRQ